MTAYYNEIEPNAAAWLRTLISEGHIAPGDVDTRSIVDVRSSDLEGYRQVHFFAGIGGWSLALRLAGVGDQSPVWTGSCPCQPFSAAGQRKGFADDRHLWPEFRRLIAERRPATIFGEQVASAADWLRLVRGDLEAMEYAVGAMPIEAASAGADHLRDRFWFVGDLARERRREGWPEHEIWSGRPAAAGDGSMGDADQPGSQGPRLLPECADQCAAGAAGVADAANCSSAHGRQRNGPSGQHVGIVLGAGCRGSQRNHTEGSSETSTGDAAASWVPDFEWVIGADGKARRVKSGVRLLVDGLPNRVGLLRGFGNAIDPRPAAAFIKAAVAAAR